MFGDMAMSDEPSKIVIRSVDSVGFYLGQIRYTVERENDGSVFVTIDDGNVTTYEVDSDSILDICAKIRFLITGDGE